MPALIESVLWRSISWPGHESARLLESSDAWRLEGTVAFFQAEQVCALNYAIVCSKEWETKHVRMDGWVGERAIEIEIVVEAGEWRLNGSRCEAVDGCVDIDLNFSPSTNLLPIRRLDLEIGQEAVVRAAWLRFPNFALEPLEQSYLRTGERSYRYRNLGSEFTAELRVSGQGLVLDYEGTWTARSTE